MHYLRIKNWETDFETPQSRKIKGKLSWVAVPTDHAGRKYRRIADLPNGAEVLGVFVCVVQVAARSKTRGTLIDDRGHPLDAGDLAEMCGMPPLPFWSSIETLIDQVGVIERVKITSDQYQSDPNASDRIKSEPNHSDQNNSDQNNSDQIRSDPNDSDQITSGLTESPYTEQNRTEQNKQQQARATPVPLSVAPDPPAAAAAAVANDAKSGEETREIESLLISIGITSIDAIRSCCALPGITPNRVRSVLRKIEDKTNVRNRAALALSMLRDADWNPPPITSAKEAIKLKNEGWWSEVNGVNCSDKKLKYNENGLTSDGKILVSTDDIPKAVFR